MSCGVVVGALAGSAAAAALLLIGGAGVRRLCGPRGAYACWLVPWLGAATSFLPTAAISHTLSAPARVLSYLAAPLLSAVLPVVSSWIGDRRVFAAVWAMAALLFLGRQLLLYCRFVRDAKRYAVSLPPAAGVPVLRSSWVTGPVAAGLLRRRIFVPADFERRFSASERVMVLRHEQAHHDRHDLVANLLALILLSLHWWNPLAYYAYRRFRADQELACDATATRGLSRDARFAYGTAILKCAAPSRTALICAMGGKSELRSRLLALAKMEGAARLTPLRAAATVAILSFGTLLGGAATLWPSNMDDTPFPSPAGAPLARVAGPLSVVRFCGDASAEARVSHAIMIMTLPDAGVARPRLLAL